VALTSGDVASHLKQTHGYKMASLDVEQLRAIAETEEIFNALPSIASGASLDAFEGIKIHQGSRCSLCRAVSGSSEYM
jgi:hypothetical protein